MGPPSKDRFPVRPSSKTDWIEIHNDKTTAHATVQTLFWKGIMLFHADGLSQGGLAVLSVQCFKTVIFKSPQASFVKVHVLHNVTFSHQTQGCISERTRGNWVQHKHWLHMRMLCCSLASCQCRLVTLEPKSCCQKPVQHLVLIKSLWIPLSGYHELWRHKDISPFFCIQEIKNLQPLSVRLDDNVHMLVLAGCVMVEHCYLRMELFTERKVERLQSKYMWYSQG